VTDGIVVLDVLAPASEADEALRRVAEAIGRPRIVPDARGKVTVWTDDIERDRARIDDVLDRIGDIERQVLRPRW
jgi:predicted deacylase